MSDIENTFTEETIKVAMEIDEPEWLLAHLLLNDVVFINTNWSEKEWTEEAREGFIVLVTCNDSFGPYADCERIRYKEIKTLYRLWRHDPFYGSLAWVMAKRKEPTWAHKKIDERMKARGWDVEALLQGQLPEWAVLK